MKSAFKGLILTFIIIFLLFSHSLAQEEGIIGNSADFKLEERKEQVKGIFGEVSAKLAEIWNTFFSFWGKTDQTVRRSWKGKIIPAVADWVKEKIELFKTEFRKEKEEMTKDIIRIFIGPLKNLWE